MLRRRYSLLPTADSTNASPGTPSLFDDDDEEEMLTRAPPVVYPPDPRFDQPPPPAWQRLGLVLILLFSIFLAFWLRSGFWIGALLI
ncbi:hypothetical protein C8J57DRAFT_1322755 [Mycena rebaudengoi]|jgi:hypothetical protein|nr:hypothetical protein C8J57DRAFT_1322755 [Mycena rebaudengoi]